MAGISSAYPSPLVVSCTKCSKEIKLYSHQRVVGYSCSNCGTYTVLSKQKSVKTNYTLSKVKEKTFEIGTVFKIDNDEFVLINFLAKEETTYKTIWFEYCLFNPIKGYWTISESDGHFSLIKPSKFYLKQPGITKSVFVFDIGNFDLYNKYKYKIKMAEGEFTYDVLNNDMPSCADFVKPPYILSYERTKDEILWFQGEYIDHSKLMSWVKDDINLPVKDGIAPNQPYGLKFDQKSLIRISVISVMVLILLQLLFSFMINNTEEVSKQNFYQNDTSSQRTFVSESFEIKNNGCAADFLLSSNLSNNWLEADFTLVNETTGDQYYFGGVVEHYSGYEDGESWSEGSNDAELSVGQLTKGKYHYNVSIANDPYKQFGYLVVKVKANVSLMLNFLIALVLLLIFPVYSYFNRQSFDKKRWQNSDYSPYDYGDDE